MYINTIYVDPIELCEFEKNQVLYCVSEDLPDRNCDKCISCCVDYEGWLQFQNCLYKIVRDPLFELFITTCIVLNTLFLALEHHGMSENIRQALDIGNKVITFLLILQLILDFLYYKNMILL